jgi:hypothetical protein
MQSKSILEYETLNLKLKHSLNQKKLIGFRLELTLGDSRTATTWTQTLKFSCLRSIAYRYLLFVSKSLPYIFFHPQFLVRFLKNYYAWGTNNDSEKLRHKQEFFSELTSEWIQNLYLPLYHISPKVYHCYNSNSRSAIKTNTWVKVCYWIAHSHLPS